MSVVKSAFTNFLRFFVQNILEFVQIFKKRREKFFTFTLHVLQHSRSKEKNPIK